MKVIGVDGSPVDIDPWLMGYSAKQSWSEAERDLVYARALWRSLSDRASVTASDKRRIAFWFRKSRDAAKIAAGYEDICRLMSSAGVVAGEAKSNEVNANA